jgi:5-methylcytosine-specific restriction endonuclease McrA
MNIRNKFCRWLAFFAGRSGIKMSAYRAEKSGLVSIYHSEYRWRKTRNGYIRDHNVCEACGTTKQLQVHHIKPWHLFPMLRYVYENLITLCGACHFRFGHGLNWKKWNPKIRELCVTIKPLRSRILDGRQPHE